MISEDFVPDETYQPVICKNKQPTEGTSREVMKGHWMTWDV